MEESLNDTNTSLSTTPHYVGKLSTEIDLNELLTTGIYEGANGDVPINAPDGASTSSSIIVTVYHENSLGNNFTVQEYTQVVSGELQKYVRRYSGSAWNDWDSYALNSALAAISVSSFQQTEITVNAYEYTDVEFSVARSGYTPLGVVGWWTANSTNNGTYSTRTFMNRIRLSGTTVTARIGNYHQSNSSLVDLTIYVLYKAA